MKKSALLTFAIAVAIIGLIASGCGGRGLAPEEVRQTQEALITPPSQEALKAILEQQEIWVYPCPGILEEDCVIPADKKLAIWEEPVLFSRQAWVWGWIILKETRGDWGKVLLPGAGLEYWTPLIPLITPTAALTPTP